MTAPRWRRRRDSATDPTRSDQASQRVAIAVYAVLPATILLMAAGAGVLKWQNASMQNAQRSAQESVRAATEGTVALLSYKPDTVQADLQSASRNLTGEFLSAYSQLVNDVVIPGAQEKQILAVATVPAAAATSAGPDNAVVMLFVNQTTTIGAGAPTSTASTVRVTLDRVDNRWLISQFEPI